MKRFFFITFLFLTTTHFSQESSVKIFTSDAKNVEIFTEKLDNITIITSNSEKFEVSLFNENNNSNNVVIDDEKEILKINFKLPTLKNPEGVFRKFITKRLNRAYGIIKIPKNKTVSIFGTHIDVISKSYKGDISIFIEHGIVRLNLVQKNAKVSVFQGTVYASVSKANINIKSNKGTIIVQGKKQVSPYRISFKNLSKKFVVNSINANVIIDDK